MKVLFLAVYSVGVKQLRNALLPPQPPPSELTSYFCPQADFGLIWWHVGVFTKVTLHILLSVFLHFHSAAKTFCVGFLSYLLGRSASCVRLMNKHGYIKTQNVTVFRV